MENGLWEEIGDCELLTDNRSSIVALAFSFPAWASDLPDPALTPGAVDPGITQANIQSTVCVKGYTKTVRPPAHFTNKL